MLTNAEIEAQLEKLRVLLDRLISAETLPWAVTPEKKLVAHTPLVAVIEAVTKRLVFFREIESIVLSWIPGGLYDDVYVNVTGIDANGEADERRTATATEVVDTCRQAGAAYPRRVLHLTACSGEKLEVPVDEVQEACPYVGRDRNGRLLFSSTWVLSKSDSFVGWNCREPASVVRKMMILCGVAPEKEEDG